MLKSHLEEHADIRDESFIVLLYHLHDKRRDVLATRNISEELETTRD